MTNLKVIPFFSGGASSANAMYDDPNRGKLYEVVAAFTDRPDSEKSVNGRNLIDHKLHVPLLGFTRKEFYTKSGIDPKSPDARIRYYEEIAKQVEDFEADIIAMCGYTHIISEPLLSRYVVLNVHPADLSILTGPEDERIHVGQMSRQEVETFASGRQLKRKYTGDDAVFDAVTSGESYTLSTVHVAVEEADMGPIVVQSQAFQVDQDKVRNMLPPDLRRYVDDLQGKMKKYCDGPAYLRTLELLSNGLEVGLAPERKLTLDGEELPYGGVQL